jgi:DNA-binding transcriptional MerR regulator
LDETRYSLQELTQAAGVSVRTVRYYIAEGLLPPPVSAGARSFYGEAHLNRLRLIGLLKDRFLPLKEIRRQLQDLDDDAIRDMLEAFGADPPPVIGQLEERLHPEDHRYPPSRAPRRSAQSIAEEPIGSASDYISRLLGEHHPRAMQLPAPVAHQPQADETELWRRIPLGEDAELVISDALYQRRKERIEALISWAKRMLAQD